MIDVDKLRNDLDYWAEVAGRYMVDLPGRAANGKMACKAGDPVSLIGE